MTPFTEMDIDDGQTTVDEDRIGEVICTGSKSAKIVSNAQDENIADDPSALSGSEIQTININEHNFTIEPVGVALTSPTTESMLLEFQLWCKVKRDQPVLRETNIEPNKILESVPSNGVASNVEKLGQQSDTVASFSLPVPEPEMLLSVPASVPDAQNDLLAQFTPEKEVSEEGGNGLKNPSGQKRQLMESALVQRYGSSTILSGIPHSKRIVDSIPDDDDLLSSILVGIKLIFGSKIKAYSTAN